jgi:polysaccharide biosynthesis/export protein
MKPLLNRNLVSRVLGALLLACTLALAGCSGGGISDSAGAGVFTETGTGASGSAAIGGKAAAGAQKVFAANSGSQNTVGAPEDYKISPLDVIDISVFGVADLNRTVQVSSSGQISLPLVNTVKVGGKTSSEVEREIARKLQASYLQSPQVSVYVKEYNSQKITVDGAVVKPGIYPITGRVSLLQTIALAEGLNTVADPTGILVFRTIDNKRMAARYDLKKVRNGTIPDPFLKAGDIVMVDESATKTTLRDVKDALPLTGLFQLLAL